MRLEVKIQTGANDVARSFGIEIISRGRNAVRDAVEMFVVHIEVEILSLYRPAGTEFFLDAPADGPSPIKIVIGRDENTAAAISGFAIIDEPIGRVQSDAAARRVNQPAISQGNADASAHRRVKIAVRLAA